MLTSVDVEPENQRLAREAYAEAGFPTSRARLITGRALDVLPRLTDGAYDLVFCDALKQEYPDYLPEALRLLRPGGVVAFDNALVGDRVADPPTGTPEHRRDPGARTTGPRGRPADARAAAGRRRAAGRGQAGLAASHRSSRRTP